MIDSDNTAIGLLNPIRYRGYYYDTETGFYFLQTRYYDPETGRFINADGYLSTGQGILSCNMYAYCLNNPVMHIDPSGELAYPGEIHNAVVNHIKTNNHGLSTEQRIIYKNGGYGRADLISDDGLVWDVKRNTPKHIKAGEAQVKKYTENVWDANKDIDLKIGDDRIPSAEFTYKSGIITYDVSYSYVGNGVIAYDYSIADIDLEPVAEVLSAVALAVVIGIAIYLCPPLAGGLVFV